VIKRPNSGQRMKNEPYLKTKGGLRKKIQKSKTVRNKKEGHCKKDRDSWEDKMPEKKGKKSTKKKKGCPMCRRKSAIPSRK